MRFKTKFLKVAINKSNILVWGRISKYKYYELQIEPGEPGYNSFAISICLFKRLFGNLVLCNEFILGNLLWSCFIINDTRIWDNHRDKPVTLEEYEKLPKIRDGKPKYKPRRQGVEKWYYSSKYLKLFNLDYLNDPYGITIALTWLAIYISLQLGNHLRHKFCLSFDIDKTSAGIICGVEICLFGYFVKLEFGQNTFNR